MQRDAAEFELLGHVTQITAREKITYLTVAVNSVGRDAANAEGPPKEYADFYDVRVFGEADRAHIKNYGKKGDLVRVKGRLRTAKTERNGEKLTTVELFSSGIAILNRSKKVEGADAHESVAEEDSETHFDEEAPGDV